MRKETAYDYATLIDFTIERILAAYIAERFTRGGITEAHAVKAIDVYRELAGGRFGTDRGVK